MYRYWNQTYLEILLEVYTKIKDFLSLFHTQSRALCYEIWQIYLRQTVSKHLTAIRIKTNVSTEKILVSNSNNIMLRTLQLHTVPTIKNKST